MDDSVNWESKTPDIFKPDHEVDTDVLPSRLDQIRRLGIGAIKDDTQYLRERLDQWKEHELWKHFQLSWEMFCEIELKKPAEWIDLVIQGSEDHDPSEIKLAILQTQERIADKLEQLIAKAKEKPLPKHGEIGKGRNRVDIINSKTKGGTSSDYLLSRISRDYPKVLDEIGEGKKYPSARAAAIACGIVKPKISLQIDPDIAPSQFAGTLHQKFDDDFLIELAKEILRFYGEAQ